MFSHNGMISEKQMRRILMLSVFSSSIFVLPYLFANMFGNAIALGVIIFMIMAALYVGVILKLANTEPVGSAASCPNAVYGRIEAMVYIVRYIIRLVFYITLAVAILGEGQVPFVDKSAGNSLSNVLVALPLLLVAYYGANRNIEKQGRINEMIFWAAFFPYVVMMIFGLKEMDHKILIPRGSIDLSILLRSYALLTFIVPVEIYPQLKINSYKKDTSGILTYISVMLMIILVAVLSLVMGGIYGLNGMADEPMVSVAIMRYIELPLGVLQRFDVLMIWFFMTGIFAVLSGVVFRIRKQLLKFISKTKAEIILFIIVLAALLSCVRLPGYVVTLDAFVVYGAFVDVPLSMLTMILRRRQSVTGIGNKPAEDITDYEL